MGRKKDKVDSSSTAIDLFQMQLQSQELLLKKVKKHKHKKSSKKQRHNEDKEENMNELESVETLVIEEDDQEIKVDDMDIEGNELINESQSSPSESLIKSPDMFIEKMKAAENGNLSNVKVLEKGKASSSGSCKKKKKEGSKGGDDNTDSEEERWLDAIESGKLDEVDDELKRMKNPRLMTARQRALLEKTRPDAPDDQFPAIPAEPLFALPSGFKEKVLTEEMLAKKAIKSQRRREQAIEKREEDKKKTVDRLLKKQDTKGRFGSRGQKAAQKAPTPIVTYLSTEEGVTIVFPPESGVAIPLLTRKPIPKPVICGVEGCFNLKKYSCSRSNVPLCSLRCYKLNFSRQGLESVVPALK